MATKALLESQSKRIESLLLTATQNISLLKDPQALKQSLSGERDRLLQEVERLKTALIAAEIRNGKKQLFSAFLTSFKNENANGCPKPQVIASTTTAPVATEKTEKAAKPPKEKAEKKPKAEGGAKDAPPPAPEVVDVSRLDMRVGLIVEASKHPDADNLYVEKVDVGEEKIRTVVSGLAKHIPLDAMQKRLCIFLCNLKPAKLKGISSEAMVMCANKDGVVEILTPPEGCKPGDRVSVAEYPGEPDAELNPKKKIWEQVMPDLLTDGTGKATYKGAPWIVGSNKGHCTCNLTTAQIK